MFRKILRGELAPGALKTGVSFGPAFAQRRYRALYLLLTFADVGIDFMLVSQVKGNRPVHLFQGQRREVLANRLRRVSGLEGIHDGVQGDTRASDVESAVALFNVFAVLHSSSIEFSTKAHLSPRPNSLSSRAAEAALFLAQSDHWIDLHRAARGDVARQQRDGRKQECGCAESRRVARAD